VVGRVDEVSVSWAIIARNELESVRTETLQKEDAGQEDVAGSKLEKSVHSSCRGSQYRTERGRYRRLGR
jgi:hypothetical protein